MYKLLRFIRDIELNIELDITLINIKEILIGIKSIHFSDLHKPAILKVFQDVAHTVTVEKIFLDTKKNLSPMKTFAKAWIFL